MTRPSALTAAQRNVLDRMGDKHNALVNADECEPMWWIEGGYMVRKNVALALISRGLVTLTGRAGGHPGVLYFTRNAAGRAALEGKKP